METGSLNKEFSGLIPSKSFFCGKVTSRDNTPKTIMHTLSPKYNYYYYSCTHFQFSLFYSISELYCKYYFVNSPIFLFWKISNL